MKENNEIIRDLEALITAIPALDQTLPLQVDSLWLRQFIDRLAQHKLALSDVAAHFRQPASSRLGLYVEQLWQALIDAHPDYQLISNNTQVTGPQGTIGAFDFLLTHLPSQQVEHWELACKFYLAVNSAVNASKQVWLGPNLNDDWPSKRKKLIDKQIRLAERPEAQPVLAKLGIHQVTTKRILAQGLVFKPQPAASSPQDLTWYTASHWQQISDVQDWQQQTKLDWLTPKFHLDDSKRELLSLATLTKPVFIAAPATQPDGSVVRCFVVPDDWPETAQKKAAEVIDC